VKLQFAEAQFVCRSVCCKISKELEPASQFCLFVVIWNIIKYIIFEFTIKWFGINYIFQNVAVLINLTINKEN
jgi:hypothetical protein